MNHKNDYRDLENAEYILLKLNMKEIKLIISSLDKNNKIDYRVRDNLISKILIQGEIENK